MYTESHYLQNLLHEQIAGSVLWHREELCNNFDPAKAMKILSKFDGNMDMICINHSNYYIIRQWPFWYWYHAKIYFDDEWYEIWWWHADILMTIYR